MQLSPEQIEQFKNIHQNGELSAYSNQEIAEIANQIANLYLTLFDLDQNFKNKGNQK